MNIKKLTLGLFCVIALIALKTFLNYGVTWDEEFHRMYGELIVKWYQSFFNNQAVIQDPYLIYYGGIFDFIAQLADFILPFDIFETRHLLGLLLGLWTIFFSFKIAQRIAGHYAGFFTLILLAVHPVFYGHMFANPVDIPFAAFFITAMYYILKTYDELPEISRKLSIKLGLALGLAMGIRISASPILFLALAACWLTWGVIHRRDERKKAKAVRVWTKSGLRSFAAAFGIAWLVMLIGWPWAQTNPFLHPFQAVLQASKWGWQRLVFFEGNWYEAAKLPKTFLVKSILISLPEFFIVALLIGFFVFIFSVKHKNWDEEKIKKIVKTGTLFFGLIVTLGANFLFQKTQFDSFRHFLFLIPLLAVLGGIGLDAFFKSHLAKPFKAIVGLALCLSAGVTVWDMQRLHPYQTVYFNRVFAGGLQGAVLKYETDYWGSSYKEGIEWVIKNYKPELGRKIRVRNSSGLFQTGYYLQKNPETRERFEMVEAKPDIYLSTTRWGYHQNYPGKVLYTVQRDQVPLLYVIEVDQKAFSAVKGG